MVKIGYSSDVRRRLEQANASTMIPRPFRLYATYEVDKSVADKVLHHLISILNPNLRICEMLDGKKRVREFFQISKEMAYELLKCIAIISGTEGKLVKYNNKGTVIVSRGQKSFYNVLKDNTENDSSSMDSLFSECLPKITDFIDGNDMFDDNSNVDNDSALSEKENFVPVKNEKDDVIVTSLPQHLSEEALRNRLEKIFIEKSSDHLDLTAFGFSLEWDLVGVYYDNRNHQICEICGEYSSYNFILRNKHTHKEISLCRDCIDIRPEKSFANYYSLVFNFDIIILEYFFKVYEYVLENRELPFIKVTPIFFSVLIKLGCISIEEANRYIRVIDKFPIFVMKDLTTEEKVELQDLCSNKIVPFLQKFSFKEWRFSSTIPGRGCFDFN